MQMPQNQGLPMLRGLADETAGLGDATRSIIGAVDPQYEAQLNALKMTQNPEMLQALADMEARNPGSAQRVFGRGRATSTIQATSPDASTITDLGTRGALNQTLADPKQTANIVASKLNIPNANQDRTQHNEAVASDFAPTEAAARTQSLQQGVAEGQLKLANAQRTKQLLDARGAAGLPADVNWFQSLPANDQNAIASSDVGKSIISKQLVADERISQMGMMRMYQSAASAEARAGIAQQALQQKQQLFTITGWQRLLDTGKIGPDVTLKNYDDFMNNGGDRLVQAALKDPQAAQLLTGKAPAFVTQDANGNFQVSSQQQPHSMQVDLAPLYKISAAMGGKAKDAMSAKYDAQINTLTNLIQKGIAPPKAIGKNTKVLPVDPTQFKGEIDRLQQLYHNRAEYTGQEPYVALQRKNGTLSLAVQDKPFTQNAPSSGGDAITYWKHLKSTNPAQFQRDLGTLDQATRASITQAIGDNP